MDGDSRARVLLADDLVDSAWANRLASGLRRVDVDVATCAMSDVCEMFVSWSVDAIIVHAAKRGLKGIEVCQSLRTRGYCRWLLVCCERGALVDAVLAYEAGADDWVATTTDTALLHAKLRRALRRQTLCDRCQQSLPSDSRISEVRCLAQNQPNTPIDVRRLTRLEEMILRRLVSADGAVVSHRDLQAAGWELTGHHRTRVYDCIGSLREKLVGQGWEIQNLRGDGYRLRQRAWLAGGKSRR